jgi:hypothetical protein
VAAISRRDVWAVGQTPGYASVPVALHWDGSTWSNVSLPVLSPSAASRKGYFGCSCGGAFTAVSGTSAGDVWAVGNWLGKTLIEHWNGQAWTRIPSPTAPSGQDIGSYLLSVSAISAKNAWAVGIYRQCVSGRYCGATGPLNLRPLILHWNGSRWRYVRAPALDDSDWLSAVDAVSARDVRIVGYTSPRMGSRAATLITRWNGARWTSVQVASPSRGGDSAFYGVTTLSATQAWAVGEQTAKVAWNGTASAPTKLLVEHWNGHSWKAVSAPGISLPASPSSAQALNAAAAISAANVWAVGGAANDADVNNPVSLALIEHWNGHSWKTVPVHDPTAPDLAGVAAVSAHDVWAVGSY